MYDGYRTVLAIMMMVMMMMGRIRAGRDGALCGYGGRGPLQVHFQLRGFSNIRLGDLQSCGSVDPKLHSIL